MAVHFTTDVPRSRIDTALSMSPDHMRPILLAVRDHGVAWATIPQRAGQFEIPTNKPFVAIVGDDMHKAMGPAGFHRKSIRRLIARSRVIAIVAAEPLPVAYAAAASAPVGFGWNGLVIETRPERELEWAGLVKVENPSASLIMVSVRETAQ